MPARPKPNQVWLGPAPSISPPLTHALLASILSGVFQDLQVGAAVVDGVTWYALHGAPALIDFEAEYSVLEPRWAHNGRGMTRARRSGKVVIAEHAGFFDLFAPIGGKEGRWFLVLGPFAVGRATPDDIRERWQHLSGSQGRTSDPEFLHYIESTLETTTFEGKALGTFKRVGACLAALLGAEKRPRDFARTVRMLTERLGRERVVERAWRAARAVVDERTSRAWESPGKARELAELGLKRRPDHAMVGLLLGREGRFDSVEDLVNRDAFQRAATQRALRRRNLLVGPVARRGVVLLAASSSTGGRLERELVELGEEYRALARKFGFQLHVGVCAHSAVDVSQRYQSALGAAEAALSSGKGLGFASKVQDAPLGMIGELRRRMLAAVRKDPKLLTPSFDRFFEAVVAHCAHRLEPVRAHVEAAFDSVVDVLDAAGSLEQRTLVEIRARLSQKTSDVSVQDLASAYRAAIASLELAILRPQRARSDRGMQRASEFVRSHLAESLTIPRVARVSGFAPQYFAKLFSEGEKMTFHQYLLKVRLERARQLLISTELNVERVARMVGFPTRTHFHRAFKRAEGVTPLEYRESKRGRSTEPA